MLEEPVRHLLQGEADVLEADLLADHVERRVRKAVVHRPHHPQQHGAVAHAGVEHAQRRRARMDIGEFEPDPAGDHPLFAAGVDEQQVFLPVVEEAEVALRIALTGRDRSRRSGGTAGGRAGRSMIAGRAAFAAVRLLSMKPRMRSSVSVVIRPPLRSRAVELAVIDGTAAEGGFRKPAVPAIVGDFLQQFLGVHARRLG